ncbi:hypothetical protein Cni_G00912 [Canna indica]|uniref:Peptidase S54 rhomboid domain-containing protein n=1 Tax=Canna indica TaxID=4628 RepID=A0AAQ3JM51_9LILI|nr:hypothetical protein Cni_G00912 [Canna indica]
MSAYPSHPWLLASNPSGGAKPFYLITFASSLSLGDLLRERCAAHLHLLLRSPSSSSGDHRSGSLPPKCDFWCRERHFLKRNPTLEKFSDAISGACSSYFSFFGGEESGGRYLGRGSEQKRNSERKPFDGRLWTNVLLAVNVLVYAAQIATQGKLLLWGAKVNSLIDKGQLWRLATSSLLHANIGHLMINCYSLNSIGPTVEQLSGPRRFLAKYFTSAIASSVMSYNFCKSPAVGASGAIFGLVGSYAIFVLRHRSLVGGGKKDLQHIAHVIALNMAIGFLSKGIDNWGHLGGLLGGAAVSWFLGPAWHYVSRSADGRLVFDDRAPIFHFINRRKRLP